MTKRSSKSSLIDKGFLIGKWAQETVCALNCLRGHWTCGHYNNPDSLLITNTTGDRYSTDDDNVDMDDPLEVQIWLSEVVKIEIEDILDTLKKRRNSK